MLKIVKKKKNLLNNDEEKKIVYLSLSPGANSKMAISTVKPLLLDQLGASSKFVHQSTGSGPDRRRHHCRPPLLHR